MGLLVFEDWDFPNHFGPEENRHLQRLGFVAVVYREEKAQDTTGHPYWDNKRFGDFVNMDNL